MIDIKDIYRTPHPFCMSYTWVCLVQKGLASSAEPSHSNFLLLPEDQRRFEQKRTLSRAGWVFSEHHRRSYSVAGREKWQYTLHRKCRAHRFLRLPQIQHFWRRVESGINIEIAKPSKLYPVISMSNLTL